jgi:hypothetical protein
LFVFMALFKVITIEVKSMMMNLRSWIKKRASLFVS